MDDSLHERKMQFATLLQRVPREQRLTKASVVAKAVVGKDANKYATYVLQIADDWPHDPVVIAEIDRLDLIPLTKEQLLQMVLDEANDRYADKNAKKALLELYAKIAGYIGTIKDSGANSNELLTHLQALHSAVSNPVDT
jgi:hypothetical protein